jgi:hypothetical protein
MNFNMNTTWSHGIDLVRENFQLLAVIAGVFLLLPSVAAYLLIPDFQTLMDPTADPEPMAAQMAEIIGPLVGVGLIAAVFQFAGYGAMIALMGDDRPTVGQALATGFKIVPSTLAVLAAFIIIYFVSAVVIVTPFALLATLIEVPALVFLATILVLAAILLLMTRMSMSMPVLVLERTLNPLTAIGRSFKMTAPRQWSILLFWGLLLAVYAVIALLLSGIFGLIAALFGGGPGAMLILGLANGLMGMVIGMLMCGLSVAMHGQLAGTNDADIARTFD